MKCNVGGADRAARFTLGGVSIVVGTLAPLGTAARIASFVIGGVALATAISGYCPLNDAIEIDTCNDRRNVRSRAYKALGRV